MEIHFIRFRTDFILPINNAVLFSSPLTTDFTHSSTKVSNQGRFYLYLYTSKGLEVHKNNLYICSMGLILMPVDTVELLRYLTVELLRSTSNPPLPSVNQCTKTTQLRLFLIIICLIQLAIYSLSHFCPSQWTSHCHRTAFLPTLYPC